MLEVRKKKITKTVCLALVTKIISQNLWSVINFLCTEFICDHQSPSRREKKSK